MCRWHFLLDPANRKTHTRDWKGLQRHYYAYPYQQRYIWGATAGMIKNLRTSLPCPSLSLPSLADALVE